MFLRAFVLIAALLASAPSPSIALPLVHGRFMATLDGERLRTRDAHHSMDEVTDGYSVVSCIRHIKHPESGYACLHRIVLGFELSAGATGPVPCGSALYETYPDGDVTADTLRWLIHEGVGGGCSIEIRRNVADRFDRAGRLRGVFEAIVSPSTGQGGPDREIKGKFRTRLFETNGD